MKAEQVDFLCFNESCVGLGRWSVLVDSNSLEPLDEQDGFCPTCDESGEIADESRELT